MTSEENVIVSVITPAFNGAKFIRRLVESVELQNFHLEHIVVDDCSTDNSWEILLELSNKYKWLKVFRLEENKGPIVARNKAIELANGRFLAFLDVDDFWLPNKLSVQVEFMLRENVAISYSDYRFVNEEGAIIGRRLRGFNKIGWNLHHMTRYLGCLTMVVDRYKINDFFFPKISPAYRAEDFLAWSICISKGFNVVRCPYDLARYSVVENSRSSKNLRAAVSVWKLYRNLESLSLIKSSFYFICYTVFTVWKRIWFRPFIQRERIDKDFKWSVLK